MASSILDVAREAQVAPSTVSLVINGRQHVSEKTRRQVKAVIRRLNYRPRATRQTLNLAVLYTRNMIVNGALAEYCRQWIQGIRDGVKAERAQVSVFAGEPHVDQDLVFKQSLDAQEYDGVIVMGAYPKDGYLERVLATPTPVVVFNRRPRHAEFSCVCIDYYGAARHVAQQLHELGHRKVGLFTPRGDRFPSSELRQGFIDTVAAHAGMTLALDVQAPEGEVPDAFFQQAVERARQAGITALFSGDPAAVRLCNHLQADGCEVPGDLSIVGFDDMGLRTQRGQRVTSVGYDKHIMGRLAGQMMQTLLGMGDQIVNQVTTVPAKLVQGGTLGPAPAAPSV